MYKNDIDEILLINFHLVKNKLLDNHEEVNLIRDYLNNKIKKLIDKNKLINYQS